LRKDRRSFFFPIGRAALAIVFVQASFCARLGLELRDRLLALLRLLRRQPCLLLLLKKTI